MKALIIFLFAALLLSGGMISQEKPLINPFDTLKYDRVTAYDYDGEGSYLIVEDGELVKVDTPNQRGEIYHMKDLTKMQISRINKTVGDTASYGLGAASCFNPRMGIVYYRKEKIVGHISICLECNYLESTPPIAAVYFNANKINGIDIKDWLKSDSPNPYKPFYGLRLSARETISNLCKELKFGHCDNNIESIQHILFMEK